MRNVLAIASALVSLSIFVSPVQAQRTSTILIHVPNNSGEPQLEIRVERQQWQRITSTAAQGRFHTVYRHVITWPVLGRPRRSDFSLVAKLSAGTSRTFYLRLSPNPTPVNIYVFNRPEPRDCRWHTPHVVESPEQIYRELARAEAMLLIQNAQRRCPEVQMQQWTRRWAELTLRLWRETDAIRIDDNVLSAIRWAHANPRRPFGFFASGPTPYPREFDEVMREERRLAAKFN